MFSMTRALHCIKTEAQPSTQKEQHYVLPFSSVSLPEEELHGPGKVITFVKFEENLIPRSDV